MIPLFAHVLAQFELGAQHQLDRLDQPAVGRRELRQFLLAFEQGVDLLFGGGHGNQSLICVVAGRRCRR